MEASISMASLLGALDTEEFRPRPCDASRSAIDIALQRGWVEGQKSRPALRVPDRYRLTQCGEKAVEFYLR